MNNLREYLYYERNIDKICAGLIVAIIIFSIIGIILVCNIIKNKPEKAVVSRSYWDYLDEVNPTEDTAHYNVEIITED